MIPHRSQTEAARNRRPRMQLFPSLNLSDELEPNPSVAANMVLQQASEQASNEIDPEAAKREFRFPKIMPFFWLAIAAASGIFTADKLFIPISYWIPAIFIGVVVWIAEVRHRSHLLPSFRLPYGLILTVFCLAAILYNFNLPKNDLRWLSYYNGQGDVELTARVIEPPAFTDSRINLTLEALKIESQDIAIPLDLPKPLKGKLQLSTALGETYHYGDVLKIKGELQTPPEGSGFDYRSYLRHQGIISSISYAGVEKIGSGAGSAILNWLYQNRDKASSVLQNIFPADEASLLKGILLGDSHSMPADLKRAYAVTGTAHIYAISGFNMAILSHLVYFFFSRRMQGWRVVPAVIAVLTLYSLLVGASASVVRAAIMSSYLLIANMLGRKGNLLNTLGLTVLTMLLFNPHLLWDIGFQMTVMASFGLALCAGPFTERFKYWAEKKWGEEIATSKAVQFFGDYFLVTLVAQVFVLPITAYNFHQLSPLFLIANPLILPIQPQLMVFSLIAMTSGFFSLSLANLLAKPAWVLAGYTNGMVRTLTRLFPANWQLPAFDAIWVFLAYGILAILLFSKASEKKYSIIRPTALLVGTGLAAILVWVNLSGLPEGLLKLRFLPGNDQPNILLSSPKGRYILIAGGGSALNLSSSLGQALPLSHSELDFVIIPQCGRDNVSALFGIISQFQIRNVLWLCDWNRIKTTQSLYESLHAARIPQRRTWKEDQLVLSDESVLEFGFDNGVFESIMIRNGNFSGVLPYTEAQQKPANLLFFRGLLHLSTSPAKIETMPTVPIALADFKWLEVRSSSESLSLYGERR